MEKYTETQVAYIDMVYTGKEGEHMEPGDSSG